ncbi:MAG: ATP-binding protein [Tannerella sp.]|jgi:AAA+ ATPase superfamily predicted ATPase|nr:ATP-binding protein [Tannerella sp.]
MQAVLNNPFMIAGYHSPRYFCDREKETAKIISALQNDRNISLISPRRIGKTGLINHVFHRINESNKDVRCFYLDIFPTQNLNELVNMLGKALLGRLDNYSEAVMRRITNFFKSCRPVFTFDPASGTPLLSLDIKPKQSELGLEEIFAYIKESGKRCYIAMDEFQQITEYPEKGVEALLRTYMQFIPNVKFIFAGSKKHLMDAMFSTANRPFYQSTQKIVLRNIPIDVYRNFALRLFNHADKKLTAEVFDYIYTVLFGHTWYMQFILNELYSLSQTSYSTADVDELIRDVLQEETATYKTYCETISKGQLRLLKAIAKERKLAKPFDSDFMRRYALTAPSSVKLALTALINKTLILRDDDGDYFVYDRFFAIWLQNN